MTGPHAVIADAVMSNAKPSNKRFADLAAQFAMKGWQFWRSDATDGPVRYFASRWGHITEPMPDLVDAERFLARVEGKA